MNNHVCGPSPAGTFWTTSERHPHALFPDSLDVSTCLHLLQESRAVCANSKYSTLGSSCLRTTTILAAVLIAYVRWNGSSLNAWSTTVTTISSKIGTAHMAVV